MIRIVETTIPEVRLVVPDRFDDSRGFFSETYTRRSFEEAGIDLDFVQDNHSFSRDEGVVRGLHFQLPPFAQDKLVRVVRGAIVDVALDVRRTSPTFGHHVAVVLSAENWMQAFVPAGFAHGFCTLEPDTEVLYKVSAYYDPASERGVLWNDPDLGIDWPVDAAAAIVSERDARHPRLRDLGDLF